MLSYNTEFSYLLQNMQRVEEEPEFHNRFLRRVLHPIVCIVCFCNNQVINVQTLTDNMWGLNLTVKQKRSNRDGEKLIETSRSLISAITEQVN